MTSLLLMMMSVLMFSLYPLLASLGLRGNDPILFVAMAHLACGLFAAAGAAFMLRKKYGAKKRSTVFKIDGKTWAYIAATATAGAINHMCFMFALLKTSKAGATIIYETWPIIGAWLAPFLIAKGWEQVRRMDYVFGLLAVAGIAFVVAAENRGLLSSLDMSLLKDIDPDRLTGYGLALLGSIGVAVSTALRRRVTRGFAAKFGDDIVIGTYLGAAFTRLTSLPVFAVGFMLFHTSGTMTFNGIGLAAVTGIAVHLLGSLCYLFSILRNPNPSIPVPDFLAPIMAVAWLYFGGYSSLTDFVVIGGLFVITANLLVTVRAEDGFAYTASILTILLAGGYCYFTQGSELPDFYDAVALSAVFYAILIAFAWDRVLERTKHEEGLALDIAYGIETLKQEAKAKTALLRRLVTGANAVITTTDRATIGAAYHDLAALKPELGTETSVGKIYRDLDSLILSKTKDIMLSEIVLLCLIGGITFFGILGYRPTGLWPDMMAFIMGGAIVFIFFAIFDQQNARNKSMLQATPDSLCTISSAAFESRHEFKLVTIILIGIMLAVFYGLFKFKYGI
ncbi:MAG: DMT family transporter [bacterium]|nr:DMT family transporter [bacterium]